MEIPLITEDDVMDVLEMTDDLGEAISEILEGNDRNLALSALIGASINGMLGQCDTLDEIFSCRSIFIQVLDSSISAIRIEGA